MIDGFSGIHFHLNRLLRFRIGRDENNLNEVVARRCRSIRPVQVERLALENGPHVQEKNVLFVGRMEFELHDSISRDGVEFGFPVFFTDGVAVLKL